MRDTLALLDDGALRRGCGPGTLTRAYGYVGSGRLTDIETEAIDHEEGTARAGVRGSQGRAYVVTVGVGQLDGRAWWSGDCSCPVGVNCKHAVALLITVRDETATAHDDQAWQRDLDSLLDEFDRREPAAAKPLGLQFELQRSALSSRHLTVRPVRPGARAGTWVKSGVDWQTVSSGVLAPAGGGGSGYRSDHLGWFAEFLALYRASQRMGYYGSEQQLSLTLFGAGVWRLLERAGELGIAFLPGPGLSAVRLHPAPLPVALDAHRDDESVRLSLGVEIDGEWHGSDALQLVGMDAHGVILIDEGASDRYGSPSVTLAPLVRPAGVATRRLAAKGGQIRVPSAGRDDLVADYLPRLGRYVEVASADGSVPIRKRPLPGLALTVEWRSVREARVGWSFRYRIGDDDRSYPLDDPVGHRNLRDATAERELLDTLVLDDEQRHRLCTPAGRVIAEQTLTDLAAIGLADLMPALLAHPDVEVSEVGVRPDYREATGAPVITFAAADPDRAELFTDHTDWLDLDVVIAIDGTFIGLADVLEAMTLGRSIIIMKNGVHLRLDRPEFRQLADLVAAAGELQEQPANGVRLSLGDLGLWDELADLGIVDQQAARWVDAARRLIEPGTLDPVDPVGLHATLRPYQLQGFRWLAQLWQAGLGGILADDMGLGKTLQTLGLVGYARAQGSGPFLVVAPTSVVSAWAHEAEQFTPGLRVATITESQARRGQPLADVVGGADLAVCTYTLLRLEIEQYAALSWGGLVLDEAHQVKNHQSKTYQAVRRLDVPFRLALTGTPLENRLMELWSLLSIVAPGLYPWPQRFQQSVADPVEKAGEAAVLDRFRRRIRPFLLRRTKELVAADLPEKTEQVLEVPLTAKHRHAYDTHLQRERQHLLGLIDDFDRNRIAIFKALTTLRQLSLDPVLVDDAYAGIAAAKTDTLVDHLHQAVAEGHRALVFSQFTRYLGRLRDRLEAEGIATRYLDGRTRARAKVIDDFKAGGGDVFLISLRAGGVGLTLTEADYVFVMDPWWNPAVEAQAVDRAHRIGQQRPVLVYRLVSANTIEQKVMDLKERKRALFSRVVDGEGAADGSLTADDIRALLDDLHPSEPSG
ncbi:MAG: DEAD/DEAH box helicase [Nocardioidaceae bacterium]